MLSNTARPRIATTAVSIIPVVVPRSPAEQRPGTAAWPSLAARSDRPLRPVPGAMGAPQNLTREPSWPGRRPYTFIRQGFPMPQKRSSPGGARRPATY
jgi:hypothetical protein